MARLKSESPDDGVVGVGELDGLDVGLDVGVGVAPPGLEHDPPLQGLEGQVLARPRVRVVGVEGLAGVGDEREPLYSAPLVRGEVAGHLVAGHLVAGHLVSLTWSPFIWSPVI